MKGGMPVSGKINGFYSRLFNIACKQQGDINQSKSLIHHQRRFNKNA